MVDQVGVVIAPDQVRLRLRLRLKLTTLAVAQTILVNLVHIRPRRARLARAVVDAVRKVGVCAQASSCGFRAAQRARCADEGIHAVLLR